MPASVHRAAVALLAFSAVSITGCFTLAKQAFVEARGAQGEVLSISELHETALGRCQGLEFTPATTTAGPRICPAEVLRAYDRSANQLVARLKPLYPGGAPVLRVDTEMLYFQKKGLLGQAILLARIRMHADNQLAVDAIVKVESKAFRAGGEDELARGATEGLRKYLEMHKQRGDRG